MERVSDKMDKLKLTSKGRKIIKPKRITTSSDENVQKKRKIIKQKPSQVNKELENIASEAVKITHPLFTHDKKQMKNSSIKENASTKQRKIHVTETSSSLPHSITSLNQNTIIRKDINNRVLREIVQTNDHSNRLNNINCSNNNDIDTNSLQSINMPSLISGKKKYKNIVMQQKEITAHSPQQSESSSALSNKSFEDNEENISFQNKIIQLLNKIVEQNTCILSQMTSLQSSNKVEVIQENLYNRPEDLPLTTMEEFNTFDSDTERLHILKQHLRFIGGIKLREALHRFLKETMTDELISKFTYWGRKNSIPFYNTKIATVFFQAAKACQTFEGPRDLAEFKNEIMEVLRTAKQRYTVQMASKRNSKEEHVLKGTNNTEESSDNNCETDDSTNYEACDLLFPDNSDDDNSNV